MCVYQCPCGMVVSTDRSPVRCIRCGKGLGADHLLVRPVESTVGEAQSADTGHGTEESSEEAHGAEKSGTEKSREEVSPGATGAGRHTALGQELLLVIIAAARNLRDRTASGGRAGFLTNEHA